MREVEEVVTQFCQWAESRGIQAALRNVEVESLGVPHKPKALPKGLQGVYAFRLETAWPKVGKAGLNSNARWFSQHYKATRSLSNLARSLLQYAHFSSFEHPALAETLREQLRLVHPDQMGDWIKEHTARFNFLIKAELGPLALDRLGAAQK